MCASPRSPSFCLSGAGVMGVSIGNARVCERSFLVVYLTRSGVYILISFAPEEGVVVIVSVGPCLLCHSLTHSLASYKNISLRVSLHPISNTPQTIVV
jgi:hypothetical protein